MRVQKNHDEVIGRVGDEIYVLNYTFDNGDGFKGATGSVFRAVPDWEVEEATGDEDFREWAREIWQEAVRVEDTDEGLDRFVAENWSVEDRLETRFDQSYAGMHNAIRSEYDLPDEAVIECIGGGRCFDAETLDAMEWLPDAGKFETFIREAEGL